MRNQIIRVIRQMMETTPVKRIVFFSIADAFLIATSMYMSFWLRFDGIIPSPYAGHLPLYILAALSVKMAIIGVSGLYNISWRFFSLKELLKLTQALIAAMLLFVIIIFLVRPLPVFQEIPRSVLLLDFNLTFVLLGALRISKRVFIEYRFRKFGLTRDRTKVLVVGAGDAGEKIVREMMNNRKSTQLPLGFVDDDEGKRGIKIHGIKVLGKREDIPKIIGGNKIDEVLIAIPSANSRDIREIVELVRSTGKVKNIKILPRIRDIMEGKITLSDIQDIQVEDLLGREPVQIDYKSISGFLNNKTILISGAGGSIGGELVSVITRFKPAKIVLLDNDETELFHVMNRLKARFSDLIPVVATIRDREKVNFVLQKFRPQIVLHAAALKHVPILEHYPEEAVKTNILGTRNMGEAAKASGVERFVNISTDKAINPTSVMGASKRVAEEILKNLNETDGTQFISVRFGNVLGSRGSVIPLFKEQIQKGGPVTVTHPEMKRYFMAISEAVPLVLEAAATGRGGEIFILDMGKPVKIDDLAREMIRLSGHEPDVDIAIVYSGLRPGEKLFEELLGTQEGSELTEHPKIFKAKSKQEGTESVFWESVDRLTTKCTKCCDRVDIIEDLKMIVPTYKPDMGNKSVLNW